MPNGLPPPPSRRVSVPPSEPNAEGVATHLIERAQGITLAAVTLVVVEGPDRGLSYRLASGVVRIGTSTGCEVRLSDPTVSRLHGSLEATPRGVRVCDLGSTNGVYAEGVRVRDADLLGGATLTLGSTVIRVDIGADAIQVSLHPIDRFGGILGGSAEMRRIYAILDRIAPTDTTVLIQGETGTGKEAVARAIHDASRREGKPFVAVDCGAIAENLIESELFGHARGAFTGAVADRRGLFEDAHEGTLFLDEIGELPISLQPKLLRALETREVRRVGTNTARRVDVRVLAATNRPLAQAVNDGTFREDLYYRLAVVEVALPPLRARREDIATLAAHFYEQLGGTTEPLPQELLQTLQARAWPGNVRELRNAVERSVSFGWASHTQNLAPNARGAAPPPPALEVLAPVDLPLREARQRWTEQLEILYISAILRRTQGNVTRAAAMAGVNRRSFQRMMVDCGIRSDDAKWTADGEDTETDHLPDE